MAHHQRTLSRPTVLVLLVLAGLGLGSSPALAQESALGREAGEHLLHGNLRAAQELLDGFADGKSLGSVTWNPADVPVVVRVLLRQGRDADARAVLAPALSAKSPTPDVFLAAIAAEERTGTVAARLALAERGLKTHPGHVQLVLALGRALYDSGKRREARKILDVLADRYEQGTFKEPAELVAVAESLRLNGYARDANRVLEEAGQLAGTPEEKLPVELAWGQLLLSKYNYRDADRSFRAVLAVDPKHPAALTGMAQIDLKSDQSVGKARRRLDKLLANNRRDVPALLLRAEVALHDEDFAVAERLINEADGVQGQNLDVLAVRGAWCKLTDNAPCWTAVEKTARKLRPDDGRVWQKAGEYLEMAHRYKETLQVLQTAIAVEPDLWQAHAALGMGYARLVDDRSALKHLETAFAGDPFDVRTANQLNVLYDGVLKQMVTLPGRKADLRVHRNDRKGYEREMLPFLQEALDALDAKYTFAAEKPIQVEIFPETQQFSVRTVGLPALGAHAVCFGHLVTSRSPGEKPFNWKMVLWHELSHIYHIQMTEGRVPRWLTEGLAMMESAWANPRWAMRMDRRAYDRLKAGQMAKVASFNLAFSQATSMQDIIDAYYQAMLLTEYLSETYGFPKLRGLVAAHKTGAPTQALVQQELGTTAEALDVAFAGWLAQKLVRFDRDFRPYLPTLIKELGTRTEEPKATQDPVQPEEDDDEAGPEPAPTPTEAASEPTPTADSLRPLQKQLRTVIGVLQGTKGMRGDQARQAVQAAAAELKLRPPADLTHGQTLADVCTLRALLADAFGSLGDRAGAVEQAQALVDIPDGRCDGVRQRAMLAVAHKGDADPTLFWTHALAAHRLDPSDGSVAALVAEPVEKLHQLLVKGGDPVKAPWVELAAPGRTRTAARARLHPVVDLEPNEPQFAFMLGRLARADWQTATTDGERTEALADLRLASTALRECIPGTRTALLFEARQLHAEGQTLPALVPYRMAAEKATTPKDRAEIWCELADMTAKSGPKEDAAEARRRCLAERTGAAP